MNTHSNDVRNRLAGSGPWIFPSLLNCDFGILASEIDAAQRAGAVAVHWDVMDGHFVPNLSYGPPIIRSCRPRSSLIFDAHLMMAHPAEYVDEFLAAGCDIITVHLEAVADPGDLIERIHAAGALAGLAVNPPTPVRSLEPWLERIDLALVMSVMPGFGGQEFDDRAIEKLEWVSRNAPAEVLVEVDGGINRQTIARAAGAGARLLVVGSAFYGAADRGGEFETLMRQSRNVLAAP